MKGRPVPLLGKQVPHRHEDVSGFRGPPRLARNDAGERQLPTQGVMQVERVPANNARASLMERLQPWHGKAAVADEQAARPGRPTCQLAGEDMKDRCCGRLVLPFGFDKVCIVVEFKAGVDLFPWTRAEGTTRRNSVGLEELRQKTLKGKAARPRGEPRKIQQATGQSHQCGWHRCCG